MTNALFGFPSYSYAFTLSGGAWQTFYPVVQLQMLPLSKVARSTNAALTSTIIDGNTTTPITAGMIALVRHNLSSAASIKLTTWSNSARTTITYAGAFENVWTFEYSVMMTNTAQRANAVWTWWKRFSPAGSAGITVGSWRIEISDAGNPAGYVQAGWVEIAQVYEPSINFQWGFEYGFAWRTQITEALGGAEYVDRRPKPRTIRGSFPHTLRTEALQKFFELQRQHDMNIPFLFVPTPDDTANLPRTVMLARQMDPGPLSMVTASHRGLLDNVPIAFREIIG